MCFSSLLPGNRESKDQSRVPAVKRHNSPQETTVSGSGATTIPFQVEDDDADDLADYSPATGYSYSGWEQLGERVELFR
jgi:hypothetical protein